MSSDKAQDKPKSRLLVKVILCGDPDCGKSELQKKLGFGFKEDHYEIVLGVDFSVIEADVSKMQLWQITAQDRFDGVSYKYYRGSSVAGIVYDVTRPETLARVPYWASRVKNAIPNASVALIGNKIDLDKKYSEKELEEVTNEVIRIFPHMKEFQKPLKPFNERTGFLNINNIPIIEVSALRKINIDMIIDVFENLAMAYIASRKAHI